MAAKTAPSRDRTDEAVDWITSVGEDPLDAGAEPEDLVEIAKDAVRQRWSTATFQDEELLGAARGLV